MPKHNKSKQNSKNTHSKNNPKANSLSPASKIALEEKQHKKTLLVPTFYVENAMLGEDVEQKWTNGNNWQNYYKKRSKCVLNDIFKGEEKTAENILKNLANPCVKSRENQIPWTFYPTPLPASKKKTQSDPFSIIYYTNSANKILYAIVYDRKGQSCLEINYANHGMKTVHGHPLIRGGLDHPSGQKEEHAFVWKDIPWLFVAVPAAYGLQIGIEDENLQLVEITIEYDPNKKLSADKDVSDGEYSDAESNPTSEQNTPIGTPKEEKEPQPKRSPLQKLADAASNLVRDAINASGSPKLIGIVTHYLPKVMTPPTSSSTVVSAQKSASNHATDSKTDTSASSSSASSSSASSSSSSSSYPKPPLHGNLFPYFNSPLIDDLEFSLPDSTKQSDSKTVVASTKSNKPKLANDSPLNSAQFDIDRPMPKSSDNTPSPKPTR